MTYPCHMTWQKDTSITWNYSIILNENNLKKTYFSLSFIGNTRTGLLML